MEFVSAKTMLLKTKYSEKWFGEDYTINLYRGCCHSCIYCDSRSNCYHIDNFDKVRGKENGLYILEKELSKKREKGVVGIGSMSDSYNPFEIQYQQTRKALELFERYGFGVGITTKSDLIVRDVDLLKSTRKNNNVIVKFTITTPDDELSKIIEPNVCPSSDRFKAMKTMSDNGIFTGVLMTPVLPFITDSEDNIRKLVQLSAENGAKFIYTFMSVTLRENQRDYYYQKLDEHFKGLKEKYISTYGNTYNCVVPDSRRLYKIFSDECKKYGLLYKMSDIINAYKKEIPENEQLTLY